MTPVATYGPLELCENEAGYEAVPETELDLDLDEAEAALEEAGWDGLANAGMVLVVGRDGLEVSVFEGGKLMVKTQDGDEAREAAGDVREALGI